VIFVKALESLGVVIIVVVFIFFNFYVVRELGLLRADVNNINSGLSELRRESYRVADMQAENADLRGKMAVVESRMDVLASFSLATYDLLLDHANASNEKEGQIVLNNVVITKRPTGTPIDNIPEQMKEIQNLSEPNDRWAEFCFQERKTNTTLCYRNVE